MFVPVWLIFSEPWVPVTNLKGNFLLSQDPVLHVFVFAVLPSPFLLKFAMDRRGIYCLRSAISLYGCRAGLPLSHFGCRI